MASTAQGRQITEDHRQAQLAVRAAFLAQFIQLWPLLSWPDLDRTFPSWIRAVAGLIRIFRQESADRSLRYYQEFRALEKPRTPVPAPQLRFGNEPAARNVRLDAPGKLRIGWGKFDEQVERSLLVTGPGELKRRAGRGEREAEAKRAGLVVASNAASRHVVNGGRETVLTLVEADDVALGWSRVTDSDPCGFCALLASRGPVYRSPKRAAFQAHDGCCCTAEPVFASNAAWPGRAREFQRLYYRSTKGYSGKDAINAFRRAHEANRRAAALPRPLTA